MLTEWEQDLTGNIQPLAHPGCAGGVGFEVKIGIPVVAGTPSKNYWSITYCATLPQ